MYIYSSQVKVLNITPQGIWLFVEGEEYFLSFVEFPWFENAPVKAVFNVEKQGRTSFYWPDLDVDLALDNIKHPEKYPLKSKILNVI